MRSARRKAATTKPSNTADAPGGAKSTNVPACATPEKTTSRSLNLNLNHYAVVVACPGTACDFMTDVYGRFEWEMWIENHNGLPACPKCGRILEKAKRQYIEL
jgi:hypothetical protein